MAPSSGITSFGKAGREWKLSAQEIARQAIPSIRGYVYQLHRTAEAWINLAEDELLYLEVAEDFAKIAADPDSLDDVLRATQVKDTRESGSVTLNSADVLEAIEHLFEFQNANPGRKVTLTFLTTSPIGREKVNQLPSKKPGLTAWAEVASGGDVSEIRSALSLRFPKGEVHQFLTTSNDDDLRSRLLASISFCCGEGGWTEIENRCRKTLVSRREDVGSSEDMANRAYDSILAEVIRTILSSGTRELDNPGFRATFQQATNIGVPSQLVLDRLAMLPVANLSNAGDLDVGFLRGVARALLESGAPKQLSQLFSGTKPSAHAALDFIAGVDRYVAEAAKTGGRVAPRRKALRDLLAEEERVHLVCAVPGTGKSFSLWRLAQELLSRGTLIPLFLPVAGLGTCQDIREIISQVDSGCDPDAVLRSPHVCVLLDGWSEFANGLNLLERGKALRMLGKARVIANARHADSADSAFTQWSLEPLSLEVVQRAINLAQPSAPTPADDVKDMLRLPLMLSLFVFSESGSARPGELLRQFHDHLSKGFPERFTDALSVAASRVSMSTASSYQHLISEVRDCATRVGIADGRQLFERLGTIVSRNGQIHPVHDLYWSWLVGCGLLIDDQVAPASCHFDAGEQLSLAQQSGQRVNPATISKLAKWSLPLAAELEAGRSARALNPELFEDIGNALDDQRLSVRARASVAVLKSRNSRLLKKSLAVFGEALTCKHYLREWVAALDIQELFGNRHTLTEWIGEKGGDVVLDFIAQHGKADWLPWLEQLASERRVHPCEALATALACAPGIPLWGRPYLEELAKEAPWRLRQAKARAVNLDLARWLASHYADVVESIGRGSSGWINVNDIIVSCGNEEVFESLLARFAGLPHHSQESLCYAAVQLGFPWIGRFQIAAFGSRKKTKGADPFHRLSEELAPEVDDATARQWIADGYDQEGWRVLAARHGNEVLPELLAELPPSFGDQHYVTSLANLRHFSNTPDTIIPELLKRLGPGPMYPMAMEHVLNALATAQEPGIVAIVKLVVQQAGLIPAYHMNASVRLYEAWRDRTSKEILVATHNGAMPFPAWAAAVCAAHWEDHFSPRVLASRPELATEIVLDQFGADDRKAEAVLQSLKGIRLFNARLFRRMLSSAKLSKLALDVFKDCLDTFPVSALLELLRSPEVKQDLLLVYLGKTSNLAHREAHAEVIRRVRSEPTNLHHCGYVADMLRSYPRHEVLELLKDTTAPEEENSIWIVRQVERVRGQCLLDESLQWIAA